MSKETPAPTTSAGNSHWAKDSAEEDRVETLIRNSGCWDQHIGVVDCMGEKKDWRECQDVLKLFKECMMTAHKTAMKK